MSHPSAADRAYLIAEIGINHNGSPARAREMIEAAAQAGADAVKFQTGKPELYVRRERWDDVKVTPWGTMTYLEYREVVDFPAHVIVELGEHATACGIEWGVSPLDPETVRDIRHAGGDPAWWKIASPKLTDEHLGAVILEDGRPIILSTGMSTEDEIEAAVTRLGPWCLMHCVSIYPCPPDKLDLRRVQAIAERYPECVPGYSGHEVGLWTTLAAVAMGARVVERHFTLSRADWGSDQAASVEPQGFALLRREMDTLALAMGTPDKRIHPEEDGNRRKFRMEAHA